MIPFPPPPREWQMAPHKSHEQIRRDRDLERRVDQLLARPDLMSAFLARITRHAAGGSAAVETPGPA